MFMPVLIKNCACEIVRALVNLGSLDHSRLSESNTFDKTAEMMVIPHRKQSQQRWTSFTKPQIGYSKSNGA